MLKTRPILSALSALLVTLAIALSGLSLSPAQAEDPGELDITKSASVTDVEPGDTFTYTITVSCTNIGSGGCTNAQLTDSLPAGISLNSSADDIGITGADGSASADGNDITVDFTDPLSDPAGGQGLDDGATATITVPVQVDEDIDPSLDGQDLVNTATVDADNADPISDDATVVPDIPINLAADTDKSFDPASAIADPGTATTMSLTGGNASNVPVDEITLTDPADPPAEAFEYLALTGAPTVTLPAGAEQVQVDVYVDGAWVDGTPGPPPAVLPDGVDPADVQGVRIHFISTDGPNIAPGDSGSVDVPLEQRDDIADAGTGPIPNEVSTTVTSGDETSDPATADADYTIQSADIDLAASKSFDPDTIAAGGTSTVTLGTTNTSDQTLDSLTVTEPDPDGDNNIFTDGLTFSGWDDGVQWPAGATGASVTYTYADGTTETLDADSPNTLPDPSAGKTVTGFSVEFTGPIQPGAEASIPFTVTADEDQDADEIDHPNTISADSTAPGGYNGHATADDTLTTIVKRIDVVTEKSISPEEIFSVPGQTALVELSGKVTDFPDSTTDANDIIVQDPPTTGDDVWYGYFAPTGVVETPIPANATLTVEYYDGTEWVPVPGMEDIPGPDTFSGDFPPDVVANAQGIRFDYHSDDGFPPGTEVNPNIDYALRDSAAGQEIDVDDCADSTVSSVQTDVDDATSDPACDSIHLLPLTPGNGDIIDKDWDAPKVVGERTGEEAGLTIQWSTSGANNIDEMVISDVPEPSIASLPDTVFDSFDLERIDPITPALDPHLTYDQVTGVELFSVSQNQWIEAPDDPCPAQCDGTFPGYDLSADSQADTIAFRLTFAESPTRADRIGGDPEAPPVGSGVARSSGNDRDIHPVFQIRDELRSDNDVPVLAEDFYNVANGQGQVRNTARATVVVDGDEFAFQDASDIITITPVNVTANITKDWDGGPLGVPAPGTASFPDEYPTGRVSLAGENTTPRKVDSLTIDEPVSPSDPFDVFNLQGFRTITPPGDIGADDVTITLQRAGGSIQLMTRDEALNAAESDLTDVVGFEVKYTGRIVSEGTANVVFDTRLRPDHRDGSGPVTAADDSPVNDLASATASDLDNYPFVTPRTNTDTDSAEIALEAQGIGLEVTKDISPASQTEPDDSPVTVTLTGQPSGPSRTNWMQLTDDDTTFFNAYDFTGFGDFSFTNPINQVQVDAYTGGTFSAAGGDVVRTGGQWVNGTPGDSLVLPDGVTADQVQGLRFTFTKADGTIWENPSTPEQTVLMQVQRRADLRSGGPVLTDLAGNQPMPGEDDPGVSSDTVDGENRAADTVNGVPLTAADDDTDTILYKHSNNAVEVGKTPSGSRPPAQDIPYTLTFTNTGDTPITNPVITDHLPSDADGPLLVKDPDLAEGDSGYTYALDGTAPDPPNGPAMPTDDAGTSGQVGVDETPTELTFTFPEGTVLEVGQTYTITTALQFRTGLPGNTDVTNTTGITGDRPWDDCAESLDDDSGECQASTTVYPIRAGALKGVKMVKADDDELGVLNTRDDPDGCQPNADGFYVGGCVPVTKPGATDTWRMRFTNTGNLPQDKVYAIDRLPTPGDTGATTSLERGSQWTPTPQTLTFVGATEGTVSAIRVYYDTDQDICTDDLETLNGCPDGAWTLLGEVDPTAGSSIDLPANATAVKVETDFADDLLQPTGTLTFDATTIAPAQSETAGPDTIAWNTVAAAAETNDGGTTGLAPKSEGNKVGVALATGPLEVVKEVTGPEQEYAPTEFDLTLECTSAGEDVDLGSNAELTVTADTPVRIDDLPWGSTCTVAEDPGSGATDFSATTVTVSREDQTVPIIIATNTYESAGFSVSKTVDNGGAENQDGDAISYGDYGFTASCTFNGDEVLPIGDRAFNLGDGENKTFDDLPAGSDCTVEETDTGGAATTSLTVNGEATDGTSAEFTLDPDVDDQHVNAVTATNTYTVGAVSVSKAVEGDGAALYGQGVDFTVQMTCRLEGADPNPVYEDTHTFTSPEAIDDWTVTDLPTGAECTITETSDGGATTSTVSPETVTVGDDNADPVEVDVTNTFEVGDVRARKVIAGLSGQQREEALNHTYTFDLACTSEVNGDTVDVDIPDGSTRDVRPADSPFAEWDDLPVGATCTVSEEPETDPDAPQTKQVIIVPKTVTVRNGATPATAVVINAFDTAPLTIEKVVTGDGADYAPDEFGVEVECSFDDIELNVDPDDPAAEPGPYDTTIAPGESFTTADLPVGTDCAVTETDTGDATSTTITGDGEVTIDSGGTTATITNEYDDTGFVLRKDVDPGGAVDSNGDPIAYDTTYAFDAACTFNDQSVLDTEVNLKSGAQKEIDGLPIGSRCTVTETDTGGARSTTMVVTQDESDNVVSTSPPTAEFSLGAGTTELDTVTATNAYGTGGLRIHKVVDGAGASSADGPFELRVRCTLEAADPNVVRDDTHELDAGETWKVDDLPAGAACTVTEPDNGGADDVTIDPGTVTVPDGDDVSVTATNTFGPPSSGGGSNGGLPGTGSPVGPGLALLGLLAVVLGGLLVRTGRRMAR